MLMLPVASGKGGVGKSLIAANLAIALGQTGKRVVLVDLDLGGSNLHTILGMRALSCGVGTYLNERAGDFSTIVYPSEYENVRFVPGDAEIPGMANLTAGQKSRLLRQLHRLDADFVVVDLGSGSSFNTVDFFLASPQGIIVTTPSLTSILNAYLFLKNSVFRLLTRSFTRKSGAAEKLQELRRSPGTMQRLYIPTLVNELQELDPEGVAKFRERVSGFHPSMILNLLEDPRDASRAGKIRRSCKQYLGIDVDHLGVIYRDTLQNTALSSGLPILVYKPETVLSRAIVRIADKIVEYGWTGQTDPGFEFAEESYRTAEVEAEVDFEYKIDSMQELLAAGIVSQGDLVETIRTQQYEITRLRKENVFLKTKLVSAARAGFDV